MKKRIISFYSIIALSLIFTSCKNDLEVLAPGKEMVSVYGVLDATQPVQNIRINKVYVNENDALISAQDADAINYGPGELTVKLQRYITGNTTPQLTTKGDPIKKEIILTETVVTTNSGTFNQTQRIWQTTDKLYRDGEYKLIILKTATGEEIASAQNVILDSVKVSSNVMPFCYYVNPSPTGASTSYPNHGGYVPDSPPGTGTPQRAYIDYSGLGAQQNIKFKSIKNAKLYDVVMRFHYNETTTAGTNSYYIDYNFGTVKGNLTKVDEALSVDFIANDFYTNIGREMLKKSVPNLINRKALFMEYFIYAGAESLSDFLEVNAPSTTIATDKPYYTNIKGGVGIFSSRSSCSVTKDLWNNFIDKIACHTSTYPHYFLNSSNIVASSPCP